MQDTKPKLSIVLPTYKEKENLATNYIRNSGMFLSSSEPVFWVSDRRFAMDTIPRTANLFCHLMPISRSYHPTCAPCTGKFRRALIWSWATKLSTRRRQKKGGRKY